jgi:3-hydroxyacyl-CoA dehydrogenase
MFNDIAVLGAGIMGRGIALLYALASSRVRLFDTDSEALGRARDLICTDLDLMVAEGLCDAQSRDHALGQIEVVGSLKEAVKSVRFITEVVPEQLELKWQVFARLEELALPEALIASNTSTLPLGDLTRHMARPERMMITHFFNPAQLVPLVEVVKGPGTSAAVLEQVLAFLRRAGKVPVVLKREVPGFIANRLQAAVMREVLHLLASGVADMKDVDTVMTCGPGFRWSVIGPLETADFGGLDTWQSVMNNLAPELDNSRSAPEALSELNKQGRLGVKSGQGFYVYPSDEVVAEKIYRRNLAFIQYLKLRQKQ